VATKPAKQCLEFGCTALTEGGRSRCPEHEAARPKRSRRDRPTSGRRGYDYEHQQARERFLKQNPYCVRCGAPATVLDHATPHRGNRALLRDPSNWQALCGSCHGSK
jgi:5-methylcytosine-specific restriction protein A